MGYHDAAMRLERVSTASRARCNGPLPLLPEVAAAEPAVVVLPVSCNDSYDAYFTEETGQARVRAYHVFEGLDAGGLDEVDHVALGRVVIVAQAYYQLQQLKDAHNIH